VVNAGRLYGLLLVIVAGASIGCGDSDTGLPEEALRLTAVDQAGLYGVVAQGIMAAAPEAAAVSGGQVPSRFVVLARPVVDLGSFEQSTQLERFDQAVLDAIEAGLAGEVDFVSDPADGLIRGGYEIPVTTVPGDSAPEASTLEGLVAQPGSMLVLFGVPYPAWGGGFTGGPWPSDAELSVDLNVLLYQSPSVSWTSTPGIEKRAGEWQLAGYRTMGTVPTPVRSDR
jgi:hypothetical protein